jgi:hypothetical protein
VIGIEPTYSGYESETLPLSYTGALTKGIEPHFSRLIKASVLPNKLCQRVPQDGIAPSTSDFQSGDFLIIY